MTSNADLKRRASMTKASLLVGKSQVSEGVIGELDRLLEARELVKVRFLGRNRPAERDQMISKLSKETHSDLIEARGNTVTLFRPRAAPSGKIYKD
jgi:RNA-binding protein YhbY